MTLPLQLGAKARKLDVLFQAEGGFVGALKRKDGTDWAPGDSLVMKVHGTTVTVWPATLDGVYARWNKTDAEVATLLATQPSRVEIWYSGVAGQDIRITRGDVKVER